MGCMGWVGVGWLVGEYVLVVFAFVCVGACWCASYHVKQWWIALCDFDGCKSTDTHTHTQTHKHKHTHTHTHTHKERERELVGDLYTPTHTGNATAPHIGTFVVFLTFYNHLWTHPIRTNNTHKQTKCHTTTTTTSSTSTSTHLPTVVCRFCRALTSALTPKSASFTCTCWLVSE